MACSAPMYYLLELVSGDGTGSLLMEPDLASALTDAIADPARRAVRITLGRQTLLEGEALAAALAERHAA